MVIGDDYESQLAPYQENNMGDCPKEYLQFIPLDPKEEGYDSVDDMIKDGYDLLDGKPGYYENPNKKWDWYQVGGRWTGFFKLKSGRNGALGSPSLLMKNHKDKPGTADVAFKKDIDFEGMFQDAYNEAKVQYQQVKEIIGNDPNHTLWKTFIKQRDEGKIDTDTARKLFWDQPLCKKWKENKQKLDNLAGWDSSPDKFQIPEETYCNTAGMHSFMTYAYLHEGKWHGRGDMGWWGVSMNETEAGEWEKQFMKFLDSLPDDTLFTIVDCHI